MEDETPPDGCHHYSTIGEVPWDLQKYWEQRYDIFSRYDEGIWMTDDAWFGITPEPVANKVAEDLAQYTADDRTILIDAFSGPGGNTIAFAQSKRWKRIIAVEKDSAVVQCAVKNAKIYGVEKEIEWWAGDIFELLDSIDLETRKNCVVFASPPWGGPGYRLDPIFNLSTMEPYSLQQIYEAMTGLSDHVVLYLPRTSDLPQLAALVGQGHKVKVIHYCMYGASKALCAYFGPFVRSQSP